MHNRLKAPMVKYIIISIFVLLLVALTLLTSFSQFSGPPIPKGTIPLNEFSSNRAMEDLEYIAQKPHPVGSKANAEVRDYIVDTFTKLGIDSEIQKTEISKIQDMFYPPDNLNGSVENIIAKIPGKVESNNAILLTAHYDSTENGPGAADDGYGVTTILETARAMTNLPTPTNTIYFLLTDGEEPGMLGASAFAENNKGEAILEQSKVIINLEARGNKGVPILFETNDNNLEIIQNYKKSVEYPVAYSFAFEVYKFLPNDTDFSVYKRLNKQGYNFANINGSETYHEMTDNIQNANQETLYHFGMNVFGLIKMYAYMDGAKFNQVNNSHENAVYFPVSKKSLVVYPEEYVVLLFLVFLVLYFITIFYFVKRNAISLKKILFCTLLLLINMSVISILIFFIVRLVAWILDYEIYNYIYIFDMAHSSLYLVILLLITIVLNYVTINWMINKYKAINVSMGAVLLWIIFAGITSFLVKGVSYAFVIPFILSLVSILPLLYQGKRGSTQYYRIFFMILCLVPSLWLMAPILYLMYISMTIGIAPVIALISSLVLSLIIVSVKWIYKFDINYEFQKNGLEDTLVLP